MKQIENHRLNNNSKYAKFLFYKFNLKNWSLIIKEIKSVGLTDYKTKTIYLSSIFLRGASCNYERTKKALYHEIAHALTPGSGHNNKWKSVCKKLGGETGLSMKTDLPGRNWSVYCYQCKWREEYLNKPDLRNRVCKVCQKQPRLKYIH